MSRPWKVALTDATFPGPRSRPRPVPGARPDRRGRAPCGLRRRAGWVTGPGHRDRGDGRPPAWRHLEHARSAAASEETDAPTARRTAADSPALTRRDRTLDQRHDSLLHLSRSFAKTSGATRWSSPARPRRERPPVSGGGGRRPLCGGSTSATTTCSTWILRLAPSDCTGWSRSLASNAAGSIPPAVSWSGASTTGAGLSTACTWRSTGASTCTRSSRHPGLLAVLFFDRTWALRSPGAARDVGAVQAPSGAR
jgi:hypothetical protein